MAFNPNNSQDTKGSIVSPISKYKLVFLGDQSVGKTSIINRFMFDTFDGKEHPTIGIDFISKTLYYDDRTIRLQLWDTAGQERFRSLIPSYIRDSAVAIVVFDISNMSSFENVGKWIEDVRSERGSEVIMCLVANKIDLSDKRVVTTEMASQKAKDLEVLYMEVSAKIGTNVSELFKTISMNLTGNEPSHLVMPGVGSQQTADVQNNNGNIQLGDRQNILPEKKKCC